MIKMVEIKELSDSEWISMMMLRLKDSPPEKERKVYIQEYPTEIVR